MKFLLLLLLLIPHHSKADYCDPMASSVPNDFIEGFGDVVDKTEKDKTKLLRDLDPDRSTKLLEITSNFTVPTFEQPYFSRLYFDNDDHTKIKIRDSLTAERKYKEEIGLPYPNNYMRVTVPELNSKDGADVMNVPGAMLNFKSEKVLGKDGRPVPFSVENGGPLNIAYKIPGYDMKKFKIFFSPLKDKNNRKFFVKPDGSKVEFDKMVINADTFKEVPLKYKLLGLADTKHPNILAGVKNITFMKNGKPVHVY